MKELIEYIIAIGYKKSEESLNTEEQDRKNLCGCINHKESFKLDWIIQGDFTYFDDKEAINENVYRLAVYPRLEHSEIRKMKEKFENTIKIFKLDLQ